MTPRPATRPVYRLLQMNLRFNNPTPKKVLSLIGRTNPDVITLDEVSAMWTTELGYIASAYPYRILCPYPNGVFGVALLSRRPFAAGTEPHCEPRGAMAIATVDFGGTRRRCRRDASELAVAEGAILADRRVGQDARPRWARRRSWPATATPCHGAPPCGASPRSAG